MRGARQGLAISIAAAAAAAAGAGTTTTAANKTNNNAGCGRARPSSCAAPAPSPSAACRPRARAGACQLRNAQRCRSTRAPGERSVALSCGGQSVRHFRVQSSRARSGPQCVCAPDRPCKLGSGPTYQILSHVFTRCASPKNLRPCQNRMQFSHGRRFFDSRNMQKSVT